MSDPNNQPEPVEPADPLSGSIPAPGNDCVEMSPSAGPSGAFQSDTYGPQGESQVGGAVNPEETFSLPVRNELGREFEPEVEADGAHVTERTSDSISR